MNTYLVGGAVRDQLLGYPVTERDWLVVGATPQQLLDLGYLPVGKDFPVFLHPQTREEYALARTERKTAPGYRGFTCDASVSVTIDEDLLRRDLTINAMALAEDGQIIDPYRGRQDMQDRILRHVSPAFSEDPVRVLRVARFAARYAHLGFRVAEETLALMQSMVNSGEVAHLVAERVWAELHKALGEARPSVFFQVLRDCGALAVIFPEINALFGVPQPAKYHPEIDTGVHCLMVLDMAAQLSPKREVRLAALLHDLGKALTDPERWPSHQGHEQLGQAALEQFCQRLRVPRAFKRLAEHVMQYHTHCHKVAELRAGTLAEMLHHLGAYRELDYLNDFLLACEADARGRTGFEEQPYPQAAFVKAAAEAARQVDIKSAVASGLQGEQIAQAILQLRIQAIKHCQQQFGL